MCTHMCVMHYKFSPASQGTWGQDLTGSGFELSPSHKEFACRYCQVTCVCSLGKPMRKGGVSLDENMPLVIFRKKQNSESLKGNSYGLFRESEGLEVLLLCSVSLTAETSQLHITGSAS